MSGSIHTRSGDNKKGRFVEEPPNTETPMDRGLTHAGGVVDPEALAQRFHEAYERLAPSFGYEIRRESAKPWRQVPEQNRRLMTAVAAEVARGLGFTVRGSGK